MIDFRRTLTRPLFKFDKGSSGKTMPSQRVQGDCHSRQRKSGPTVSITAMNRHTWNAVTPELRAEAAWPKAPCRRKQRTSHDLGRGPIAGNQDGQNHHDVDALRLRPLHRRPCPMRPARVRQASQLPWGGACGCRARSGIQKALSIQSGHAAASGAGDRLPVDVILNVACGEYAGDTRHRGIAILGGPSLDVAIRHR